MHCAPCQQRCEVLKQCDISVRAGVVLGAVTGHGAATALAVLGGSVLGKYLSEQVVQYVGGSLFLLFAASTIVDIIRGV